MLILKYRICIVIMRKRTWEIRLILCGEKKQNFAKALSLCACLMQCAGLSRGVMDEVFHGTCCSFSPVTGNVLVLFEMWLKHTHTVCLQKKGKKEEKHEEMELQHHWSCKWITSAFSFIS